MSITLKITDDKGGKETVFATCLKASHEHDENGEDNGDNERDEQTANRKMVIDRDVDGDDGDDDGAYFSIMNFLAVRPYLNQQKNEWKTCIIDVVA